MTDKLLHTEEKRRYFWPFLMALLFVFIALIFLSTLFIEHQRASVVEDKLAKQAAEFSIEMAETLRISVENLQAAASVMLFFDSPTPQQFKGITSQYFKDDSGLLIIEWQPIISHSQRQSFEAHARATIDTDFRLWEPAENGEPIAAKSRKEYVPVLFMASKSPDPDAVNTIGLDLAWSEKRMLSKWQARDSGRAQASELFPVVVGKSNNNKPLGFAITLPVYENGFIPVSVSARQEKIIGYMAGVFSIEKLMQPRFDTLLKNGFNIDFYDHLNNENRLTLNSGAASNYSTVTDLDFFGNRLTLQLSATETLVKHQLDWIWVLLPVTLGLFGLMSFAFLFHVEHQNQRLKTAQESLLELNYQLEELSTHDALTGILNRRALLEKISHELERLQRVEGSIALVMCDLDFFKKINDQYGHAQGDRVLQAFAQNALKETRKMDYLGRLGGEEFAILLSDTNQEHSANFAERIRSTTEQLKILNVKSASVKPDDAKSNNATHKQSCSITVSIGICVIQQPIALNQLLEYADKALYRAKNKGRNRVELIELEPTDKLS